MASYKDQKCISPWIFLGLAILTKGPVALVLVILTITLYLFSQKNWKILYSKINPKMGLFITSLISFPWYILELIKEGNLSGIVFLGYHNFQRYTSVVNNHSEPFWFFIYIMILGSLPFTPFCFMDY